MTHAALKIGKSIRDIVSQAASRAIQERGHFALAIPGGSILKMLAGNIEDKDEWTSKTTLFYVNHKCVAMDDKDLATHAKARKLFLDSWEGVNTLIMDGTDDGEKEARAYEEKMRSLSEVVLPRCKDTGLPVFDLALIGVGGKTIIVMKLERSRFYSFIVQFVLNEFYLCRRWPYRITLSW